MDTIIVLSLAYILIVVAFYPTPKPATDPTMPIDYFPTVEAEPETEVIDNAVDLEPVKEAIAAPAIVADVNQDEQNDLSQFSIRQLKAMARGKIKNYSNLRKSELITALAVA